MQPPPRGCVLKPRRPGRGQHWRAAAASARLCVETIADPLMGNCWLQPPPRGCVLKPDRPNLSASRLMQPPPRGCVLKPFRA